MPKTDITPEEFQEILKGCKDTFQSSVNDIPEKFRRNPVEGQAKFTQKIKLPADLIRLQCKQERNIGIYLIQNDYGIL